MDCLFLDRWDGLNEDCRCLRHTSPFNGSAPGSFLSPILSIVGIQDLLDQFGGAFDANDEDFADDNIAWWILSHGSSGGEIYPEREHRNYDWSQRW